MRDLTPIPLPAAQRWREFRVRTIPLAVFVATLAGAVLIWRQQLPTTALVGEVEPVTTHVSSPKSGVLANLNVSLLQQVRAEDPIAQVITTDSRVLQSSLAVILAEVQLMKVNFSPVLDEQRASMDYDRLRLDWMEQRVQLATVRTKLQLAESELRRTEELHRDKVVSEKLYEEARISKERLEAEVQERSRLVEEQEKNLGTPRLRETGRPGEIHATSAQAVMQASINVQEEKLRLTEAELSPVVLRVPIDGVVTSVLRRSGEAVMAGEPIITVSAGASDKIVAFLRQPLAAEPQIGAPIQVCTRSFRRQTAEARILQVGTQLEPIKQCLLPASNNLILEMGLPILVSLPPALKLLPGEIVDLRLMSAPLTDCPTPGSLTD